MKKTSFWITVVLVAILYNSSLAQEAPKSYSFNLQQAVLHALENNAQVRNSIYDERKAQHKVKEVVGIGLPQINASLNYQNFIQIPTSLVPGEFFGAPAGTFLGVQFGTKFNTTLGFEASQLIFDGTYLVGLQSTKTFLELSQKSAIQTRTETTVNVTKAYYNVLIGQERIKLVDANVERLKNLMEDTRLMNENGFVEKIDVDRITVTYNNLLAEQEKVKRLIELGQHILKFQMGVEQNAVVMLTDKIEDITIDVLPNLEGNPNYSNRIEYSLLQTRKEAANLLLKKERVGYLPNLVLFGNLSASAMRNEFDVFDSEKKWFPTAIIGVKLGIPIFDGLQRHHRIQQAKIDVLKSETDLKFIAQSIDLETAQARIAMKNASVSLDIQKRNMKLAEEVNKVVKLKYEQGVGSNLEVLTAETALKEAQTNYFNALYEALIAKIDYEKASGNLNVK